MATNIKPYSLSSYVITQIKEKQSDNSYVAYSIGTTGQYVLVDYNNKTVLLQTGINEIVEKLEQLDFNVNENNTNISDINSKLEQLEQATLTWQEI